MNSSPSPAETPANSPTPARTDYERRQEALHLLGQARPNEISAFLDSTSIALIHPKVAPVLPEDVMFFKIIPFIGNYDDLWWVAQACKG
ncbi:hypothetical protein TrLO_g11659 [Triparma laevis f. longispina]|uniref:Uncharacterized protein n=1 Tax=Triparma laevis f. longispina TaxID=1714387 RepID=A0A9W7CC16_9STRA|nr:hypothetical protein TrLO_g11659 [Triparma laevis f. longispina]